MNLLPFLALLGLTRPPHRRLSVAELARQAGCSPFQLHRLFRRHLQESPRGYTERLRLEHAAGELLVRQASVRAIARAAGYASHEVFTRSFRRRFGMTPARYRRVTLKEASRADRLRHVRWTRSIGGCLRLFHCSLPPTVRRSPMPMLSVTRQDKPEQAILYIERRVTRSELAAMLAECFGTLFGHGMKAGLPIAGAPLARYIRMAPGLWTVQAAMPLAAPAPASGEMQPGTLPGGPVALAVHAGPYDDLPETHAAVERWIDAQGLRVAGAPWESYVTDPAQHPDPRDWRTEVCWPVVP